MHTLTHTRPPNYFHCPRQLHCHPLLSLPSVKLERKWIGPFCQVLSCCAMICSWCDSLPLIHSASPASLTVQRPSLSGKLKWHHLRVIRICSCISCQYYATTIITTCSIHFFATAGFKTHPIFVFSLCSVTHTSLRQRSCHFSAYSRAIAFDRSCSTVDIANTYRQHSFYYIQSSNIRSINGHISRSW